MLTTGEAQFLKEDLFIRYPGQFSGIFTEAGAYTIEARIDAATDDLAQVVQGEVTRMRDERIRLDHILRL